MTRKKLAARPKTAAKKKAPGKAPGARLAAARLASPDTPSAAAAVKPCVVGIGASAGGFQATAALLAGLPADCGLAIVIVQHLDPTQPSHSTELLRRRTVLAVDTASDDMTLQANHVYTIPSDRDAYLEGDRLRLVNLPEKPQVHLPIDRFFHSLGEQLQERAIGVVLSGTGSDGSLGLETIVSHGGIVLVQEPANAQYDGMLRSAIATGQVSRVLPVVDMPEVLCEYARHPYANRPPNPAPVAASDLVPLERILAALRAAFSLDFSGYKRTMIMRRVERRMGLRKLGSVADYADLLTADSGELDALRRDLLIGVTGFFRDPEAWKVLEREVVEPIIAAHAQGVPLRAWVAGAATGEEAYSLAMLLLEVCGRLGKRCMLQVFATDASDESIAFARRGRYPAGIAGQVSAERLRRFFERVESDQQFQVRPELRACVTFGSQRLIDDPPFSRLDLVCCRNVLMYLEPPAQRKVLDLLHFALSPGGFLFLGTAESAEPGTDHLRPVSTRWRIYQRVGAERQGLPPAPTAKPSARPSAPPPHLMTPIRPARMFAVAAEQILLERYCAAAFLVNQAGEAVHLYGRTEPYLARRSGPATHDLLSMLRPDLRVPLRRVLRRVLNLELRAAVQDARVRRNRVLTNVRMTIVPVSGSKTRPLLWLVIVEDIPAAQAPAKRVRGAQAGVVQQLEEELRSTQHDLRSSVEQLETSTQELQSTNEELVTSNEELQVANEELQSSREELQSLNEELQTVNQQLQCKVTELQTSSDDLNNLLESSQIVTVCFDRDLRVRWFSPAARTAFSLLPNDVGRAMTTFSDAPIGTGAVKDAQHVLRGKTFPTAELNWNQRWYMRRILPYRTGDEEVSGVIVTLTDITDSKAAAEAQLAERAQQSAALERGIIDRTAQLRELSVSLALTEERERQAVAADLHDDLGQTLALLKLRLDLLRRRVPPGPIIEDLDVASDLLLTASGRVRSLAFQLSPTILHELGLVPALEWLAEEMKRQYSLTVTVDADATARAALEPSVKTVLFRAVRELLINVGKHANTDAAHVHCRRSQTLMEIVVTDDGKGFDPAAAMSTFGQGGFGLKSVRERMAGLGGTMICESIVGDGSRVTLKMPLTVSTPAKSEGAL